VPTDEAAVKGKLSFESKCLACHSIAGGDKLGPDLHGVTKRRDMAWLTRWLKDPEAMLKSDATAKAMLDKYKVPMPNQNATDAEIREYLEYFKWADANVTPQGKTQPQPAAPGTACTR
jgi:nitrite reductase (NO-forming)